MDPDAGSPETRPARTARFHLWSVLAIILSTTFVTLVAVFTSDLTTFWPLFIIPILVAALAYDIPGAVVTSAVVALAVALLIPDLARGTVTRSELIIGFVTFLSCGVVVGMQSGRSRRHSLALEQSSVRDPETGLYKPSYLRSRLAEEVRRGARHEVAVTLMLVHVDDIATFRDTFGSYKATMLLEHMADILRIAVRDTDVVGRYGDDAFGVVLPFAGPAEADLVADRVKKAVCGAEFEGDVLQPATRCTVSVAYAAYPSEAHEHDALVALAEERLAAMLAPEAGETKDARAAGMMRAGEARS